MQATQATFDEWQSEPTNPLPFEAFGPTSERPLPVEEARREVWRERLRENGFSPGCLVDDCLWPELSDGTTIHRHDRHRDRWAGSNRTAFERAEENRLCG